MIRHSHIYINTLGTSMIHVHLKAVLNLQLQCTVQCNYDLRNLSDMKSECFANYSLNNMAMVNQVL